MPDTMKAGECHAWRIWLLAVVAWSLVPYKAWTRAVTGSDGFNLGDIVLLAITLPILPWLVRKAKEDRLLFWLVILLSMIGISFVKGIVVGENVREMARVVRAALFWLAIPVMIVYIPERACLARVVRGFQWLLLAAAGMIVLFSFFPSLIPADDEVAQFRLEMFGGFERVFTLGMWAVFAGAVFALSAIFIAKGYLTSKTAFLCALLAGLAFTFSRTFFLALMAALGILLLMSGNRGARRFMGLAAVGALLLALVGAPVFLEDLASAVAGRTAMLVTETPDYAFQTFVWRLSEADAMVENMHGVADALFGVLGRVYSLPGPYEASIPHISYLGMYYAHGLVGLLCYLCLLTILTLRLWQNAQRLKEDPSSWLTTGAFAAWCSLLLGAFSAPVFQMAWGVSVLAFVVGISEVTVNVSSAHHDNHPNPERGEISPPDH